jgi:hypothetical protein
MRVLKTVHLSDFQKKVMAIVKASPAPQVAFEELQNQPPEERNNIIGARDMLQKLGLIDVEADAISITPAGEKVMQDEYLVDEMGELTDEAQKFLDDASGNQEAEAQQADMGMGDEVGMEEPTPFESLDLFRLIHDQSKFLKD